MKDNPGKSPQERIIQWMKEYSGNTIFRDLRESRDLLECLVNREVSVLFYTLFLVKVSSLHELQRLTNVSSFSIIEHRIVKLINSGLVQAVSKKEPDYPNYMKCWSRMYPNTRESVILYTPTKETESFIDMLSERLSSLIYGVQKDTLIKRGELFKGLYDRITRRVMEEERARIKSIEDVFGSCNRCQRFIRHGDFKRGRAEMHKDKPYCYSCVLELVKSGEIKIKRGVVKSERA